MCDNLLCLSCICKLYCTQVRTVTHSIEKKICSKWGAEFAMVRWWLATAGWDLAWVFQIFVSARTIKRHHHHQPGLSPGLCGCVVTSLLQRGCAGAIC